MLGAKSLFRDRQLPLVKGLGVRVLAFGTVKLRQVVKVLRLGERVWVVSPKHAFATFQRQSVERMR